MAFIIRDADNVRESFTSTGTTITAGGAVANSRALSAVLANGDTFFGVARKGAEFSAGIFTWSTGGSIAQTTVWYSTNSNAAVSFSSGSGEIFMDAPSRLFDELNLKEISVASATTCDIGAVHGGKIVISGTTTITSLGTTIDKRRFVRFSGILTLTHNGTSLILPGAANITTAAGDTGIFMSDSSGNWRCYSYQRATGAALVGVSSLNGQTGALVGYFPPCGRITLASGTPVMGTSQSGQTTVYWTPYGGDIIPLFDGTNIIPTVFAEVSQATTDSTKSPAAVAASKIYDLFAWNDSGTKRVTRGPAWTNATTRGYTLTMQDGILLNTSAITNGPGASRGTWLGTIASNSGSTIDFIFGAAGSNGVAGVFNVWNAYNRVDVGCCVVDTAASYTYTSFTARSAHASSSMQVSFVTGAAEDCLDCSYQNVVGTVNVAGAFVRLGIGYDDNTTFSALNYFQGQNLTGAPITRFINQPAIGTHTVYALESSDSANANTFGAVLIDGLSFRFRM